MERERESDREDGEQTEQGQHEQENEKDGEYEPVKGTSKITQIEN